MLEREPKLVSLETTNEQRILLGDAIRSVARLIQSSLNAYPPQARAAIHRALNNGGPLTVTFELTAGEASIDCLVSGAHLCSFVVPREERAARLQ